MKKPKSFTLTLSLREIDKKRRREPVPPVKSHKSKKDYCRKQFKKGE